MKDDQEYIRDITEMRSMMERSSKFMSLSGLAGVMAGLYALCGVFIAYRVFEISVLENAYGSSSITFSSVVVLQIIFLALTVLILAIGTAILLSSNKARKKGERLWNHTARRLLMNMAVPLVAGGLLILVFISHGLIGYIAPLSLLFYGLALYSASNFTYEEVRGLGVIQIALGLVSAYFTGLGLLFWAIGFGIFHIIYGIYMHYRYER